MICPRCSTPNDEDSRYCKNCGANFYPLMEQRAEKTTDTLLFIFILVAFVSSFAHFAIQKINTRWYEGQAKYIIGVFWVLLNLSYLMVAIAIRNKNLKIIGLIVTAILVIYWLYSNVQFLMR
jgi:hypothetical protein